MTVVPSNSINKELIMRESEMKSLVNELNSFTPWDNPTYLEHFETCVRKIINTSSRFTKYQQDLVISALILSAEMHNGVYRKDEITPYLIHPIQVACIIIEYFEVTDFKILVATILHDVVEDKKGWKNKQELRKKIRSMFGSTIYSIVDFITKHENKERYERYYEIMRKIKTVSIKWRVILIKIADRIHNAENFEHISEENRRRKIKETLEEFPLLEIELEKTLLKAYKKGEIRNKTLLTVPRRAMDRLFMAIDPYT